MAEEKNSKKEIKVEKQDKVSPEKKKKRKKVLKVLSWVGIGFAAILAILIIIFVIYVQTHKMEKAKTFIVGKPTLETKILIGTQGSDFKDRLTKKIIDKLWNKNLYIKAVDVSELPQINPEKFNAIVLVNSVEINRIEKNTAKFLDMVKNKSKVILVLTSGEGDWKPKKQDVDIISTASKQEKLNDVVNKILNHVNPLVKKD